MTGIKQIKRVLLAAAFGAVLAVGYQAAPGKARYQYMSITIQQTKFDEFMNDAHKVNGWEPIEILSAGVDYLKQPQLHLFLRREAR